MIHLRAGGVIQLVFALAVVAVPAAAIMFFVVNQLPVTVRLGPEGLLYAGRSRVHSEG